MPPAAPARGCLLARQPEARTRKTEAPKLHDSMLRSLRPGPPRLTVCVTKQPWAAAAVGRACAGIPTCAHQRMLPWAAALPASPPPQLAAVASSSILVLLLSLLPIAAAQQPATAPRAGAPLFTLPVEMPHGVVQLPFPAGADPDQVALQFGNSYGVAREQRQQIARQLLDTEAELSGKKVRFVITVTIGGTLGAAHLVVYENDNHMEKLRSFATKHSLNEDASDKIQRVMAAREAELVMQESGDSEAQATPPTANQQSNHPGKSALANAGTTEADEEIARLAEQKRIHAERQALAEAEAARIAEEQRIAEEKRISEEKAAAQAEAARIAEEQRIADEKAAAQAEAARIAEEQRIAEEKARIAAMRAERQRLWDLPENVGKRKLVVGACGG
jgi:hypothetical protein